MPAPGFKPHPAPRNQFNGIMDPWAGDSGFILLVYFSLVFVCGLWAVVVLGFRSLGLRLRDLRVGVCCQLLRHIGVTLASATLNFYRFLSI